MQIAHRIPSFNENKKRIKRLIRKRGYCAEDKRLQVLTEVLIRIIQITMSTAVVSTTHTIHGIIMALLSCGRLHVEYNNPETKRSTCTPETCTPETCTHPTLGNN